MIDGKKFAEDIAKELISVQPMDEACEAFYQLYKNSKSQEELAREGYKPVSRMGLMWIKDNGQ